MASDVVFVATPGDTAINSTSDVTIVTHDVTTAVGDQLYVDGSFVILNDSGATRTYVITLDFDALFDVEFSTDCTASATLLHPLYIRGVLDIRASNLCYAVFTLEDRTGSVAGVVSGGDSTMTLLHVRGMGWGTSASDVSGTTTAGLFIRSAAATATQTCRLNRFVIRRTPVPAEAAAVPYTSPYLQILPQ